MHRHCANVYRPTGKLEAMNIFAFGRDRGSSYRSLNGGRKFEWDRHPPLEVGIVRVDSVSNMSPTFEKIRLPFKSAPPLKTITQRLQEASSSLKRQKGFVLAASVRRTLHCSGRDGKFNMEALSWQAESSASYREPNL